MSEIRGADVMRVDLLPTHAAEVYRWPDGRVSVVIYSGGRSELGLLIPGAAARELAAALSSAAAVSSGGGEGV